MDSNIESDENMIYRSCFNKLNFQNLKTFTNPNEFNDYVKNKLTKDKVFIVSSGAHAAKVLEVTSKQAVQKTDT